MTEVFGFNASTRYRRVFEDLLVSRTMMATWRCVLSTLSPRRPRLLRLLRLLCLLRLLRLLRLLPRLLLLLLLLRLRHRPTCPEANSQHARACTTARTEAPEASSTQTATQEKPVTATNSRMDSVPNFNVTKSSSSAPTWRYGDLRNLPGVMMEEVLVHDRALGEFPTTPFPVRMDTIA